MAKKLTDEEMKTMLGQRQPGFFATFFAGLTVFTLVVAMFVAALVVIVWGFRYLFL